MKTIKYFLLSLSVFCILQACTKKPVLDGIGANSAASAGGSGTENAGGAKKIAVFIPGVISGSPSYETLAKGVKRAAAERGAEVLVIEAGANQAEWESKLSAAAAQARYDLIVSSNPSMPFIADAVSKKFSTQKFMILDGEISGNPSIYTLAYNQREEAYCSGYLAGLLTIEENSKNASRTVETLKIGLIAGQNYPIMDNVIKKSYLDGAAAAFAGAALDPQKNLSLDFRVVGNWNDTAKAAEIAGSMFSGGVYVILTISGSANEGVLRAAEEKNKKVLWFDSSEYAKRPGVISGCSIIKQEECAYNKTIQFLDGSLPFGSAEFAGFSEGFVDFDDTDPLYISTVSEAVRKAQGLMLSKLRSGEIKL